jgi:peptidyl-prolyl cis-trans isomerase A (cyclophilin A)
MTRQPGTYAIFDTSEGSIVCRLFEKDAPKTVANFVELAEGTREWTHPVSRKKSKDRLYDGTIFHRVIPEFMIQGGDPAGTGMTWLTGKHTIFGEVVEGQNIADKIVSVPRSRQDKPNKDVVVKSVVIENV